MKKKRTTKKTIDSLRIRLKPRRTASNKLWLHKRRGKPVYQDILAMVEMLKNDLVKIEERLPPKVGLLPDRFNERIWKTGDGRFVKMHMMDEGHLRNAISYTQRRIVHILGTAVWLEKTEHFCQQFVYLLQEAKRRGIAL